MTNITIFRDKNQNVLGFECIGHAGFAGFGQDVVCAGISILVQNTINSIDAFTSNTFLIDSEEESGMIDFRLQEEATHDTVLLLDSMILGLQGIQNDYGNEYFILDFKEV